MNVALPAERLSAISLCSGAGGIDIALAGVARTVCYVEREAYAAAVLVARMQDGKLDEAPVWSDMGTFDGRRWRGRVGLVHAGFPCQPVSQIGQREAQDDDRWIWPEVFRVVRESGAPLVFLENVPGLLSSGLGHVLGDLAGVGFDAEWCVLGADAAGAPHQRDRVFILAVADAMRDRLEDLVPSGATKGAAIGGGGDHLGWPPGMDDDWIGSSAPVPVIRGKSDVVADRVDRIRLCGNGVVPAQARLAWEVLLARLGEVRVLR